MLHEKVTPVSENLHDPDPSHIFQEFTVGVHVSVAVWPLTASASLDQYWDGKEKSGLGRKYVDRG